MARVANKKQIKVIGKKSQADKQKVKEKFHTRTHVPLSLKVANASYSYNNPTTASVYNTHFYLSKMCLYSHYPFHAPTPLHTYSHIIHFVQFIRNDTDAVLGRIRFGRFR